MIHHNLKISIYVLRNILINQKLTHFLQTIDFIVKEPVIAILILSKIIFDYTKENYQICTILFLINRSKHWQVTQVHRKKKFTLIFFYNKKKIITNQ